MHVFIIRWCPSFSETGDGVVGQHEYIERQIRKDKILLNHNRQGYAVPFASEFKLVEYRIKKEAVGDFLAKMRAINLVPKTEKPNILDFLFPNRRSKYLSAEHIKASIGSKGIRGMYILSKLSSMGLWLQPVDIPKMDVEPYFKMGWCYNFCIGVLPDIHFETQTGEMYESL